MDITARLSHAVDSEMSRTLIWNVVFALAYFAATQVGFFLTFENGVASVLWAPTGIAFAGFLLHGKKVFPGIFLASLLAMIIPFSFRLALVEVALINTLMAFLSAHVVVAWCGMDLGLRRLRDVVIFTFGGAFVPMALSATNSTLTLYLGGRIGPAQAWEMWQAFWVGNVAGVMIVAPAILAWVMNRTVAWRGAQLLEFCAAALALITVGFFAASTSLPALHVTFPLILWVALRFSLREVALAVLMISIIAAYGTIRSYNGTSAPVDDLLIAVALFMTAISVTALFASAWAAARRAAEKAQVLAGEERFRSAFDHAPFGMALVNRDGGFMRTNAAFCQMLGYDEAELVTRGFRQMTHPDDVEKSMDLLETLDTGDAPSGQLTKRYIHRSGAIVWGLVSVSAIRDADGRILYFVSQVLDITARKNDEHERELLLARLRGLEETGRVGGWSVDRATGRQTLTPGMRAILEMLPSDAADDLTHLDPFWGQAGKTSNTDLRAAVAAVMSDGTPLDMILETRTANARPIWLHLKAEAIRSADGIVGLAGYAQDITVQHQLKEKVLASQKMESVGQLTAGIAHEFNNLLAVILLNLELVANDSGTSDFQRQRSRVAVNACERGATLTRQLLAFARKQALSPTRHNLRDLVRNSVALLEHTLPKKIALEVIADSRTAVGVEIDRAQFDNAILNLCLNARDAMPEGGLLLISTAVREIGVQDRRKTLPPGRYAVVTVQDTGHGMSEAVLKRAFEPFFTTKDVGGGTGLGLSMVHGFVHQSGGDIQIRSRTGEGTTIEMYLPIVEGPEGEEGLPASDAGPAAHEAKRILLVEDMEGVREATEIQLSRFGYHVTAVANGVAALDLIEAGAVFDMLITDLDMPGCVDGNHLAERAAQRLPDLKIVTMTGYNEGVLKARSMRSASVHRAHLQKPFSRAELEGVLTRLLAEPGRRS